MDQRNGPQQVRGEVLEQARLVGQKAMATGASTVQIQLALLDRILLIASPAVEMVNSCRIQCQPRPGRQVRHHIARVELTLGHLNLNDGIAAVRPSARLVRELSILPTGLPNAIALRLGGPADAGPPGRGDGQPAFVALRVGPTSVSYTHLTL